MSSAFQQLALASLLLTTPVAAQPRLAPVVIELSQRTGAPVPIQGAVVLRPSEGEPVRLPVVSAGPLSTRLPAGSTWEVAADLPGLWGPRKTLTVGQPDQETRLVLDLWPMGKVSGVLKLKKKGLPLPRQVLVKTLAAPAFAKRLPSPKGALDCSVDDKGIWTCSLPAATFDLVVSAEGFIPHYRWAVEIPAGKTLPLGTLELERGASVAGWAAVEGGTIESGQCVVRLAPLTYGGADPKAALDVERSTVQKSVGKDGFFQLAGLAPGTYALEVRQPGHSPARVAPLKVMPQAETFLEGPLVLTRLLELSFEISPALDWLGRPWRAQLMRFETGSGNPHPIVFEGPAAEDGHLEVPGQPPGRFAISILDSLGNQLAQQELTIEDLAAAPVRIEISLITLEGTVSLGPEPLQARLQFGGRPDAVRILMESDEEGRFHGVLPHEGDWRVDVESAEPRLRTVARVDVQAGRSGKATVAIELPDTRVFGTVVDEQGKPVAGAEIIVLSERVEMAEMADPVGSFEVRGLPEGTAWLAAGQGKRSSGRTFVSLTEGRAVGPVQLRIEPTKRLQGTVVSPLGPVAGARVDVIASIPPEGGGSARTDSGGAFQVEVPEKTQRVVAVVSAPGFALRAFDAAAGAPLSLAVSDEGGEIEIRLLSNAEDAIRQNLRVALFQNGLPIPPNVYGQWAHDQGQQRGVQSLRIPNVAPGEYRVCLVPARLPLDGDPAAAGAECASGILFRGGTLELKLGS